MIEKSLEKLLKSEAKYFVYLNPNGYDYGFEEVFASGEESLGLKSVEGCDRPVYGVLSYDLKEDITNQLSQNHDYNSGSDTVFFKASDVQRGISYDLKGGSLPRVKFVPLETKEEYIKKIIMLKEHIHNGDVYEINYCTTFIAENVELDPVTLYAKLNSISPMPFSALFKNDDQWVICASPERFIKKTGSKVISEPIKGTIKRGNNVQEDKENKEYLKSSAKERAENLMIVDLVRNDLNRVCKPGTVKVPELFGIYPYPRVFQMISTVEGELSEEKSFQDIINSTFPMGSMTGAPKLKSMELIEKYEDFKRGYFSGAIGGIHNGDFDFNVIIRSVVYNESTKSLTFSVGSAITFLCDAEQEYEECLLKASAIQSCFE